MAPKHTNRRSPVSILSNRPSIDRTVPSPDRETPSFRKNKVRFNSLDTQAGSLGHVFASRPRTPSDITFAIWRQTQIPWVDGFTGNHYAAELTEQSPKRVQQPTERVDVIPHRQRPLLQNFSPFSLCPPTVKKHVFREQSMAQKCWTVTDPPRDHGRSSRHAFCHTRPPYTRIATITNLNLDELKSPKFKIVHNSD